ncbi:acyl-CoA thioesterase II [Alisedimentitalea sp. MJ-SS2]|uniref:acyl-CoA thioesterase n=1 Tax=Aliisedimentitalea sp. MJ-SS2 TaxID=3049795 RepID=UPI002914C224|nr:acyl-CoA thioesterase II [Alisedimentitalea sp. MJ-SS2]MDU8929335.1 acyl-CoA thioesterase II [Alisedimentitalea sp. MJ-SS2]
MSSDTAQPTPQQLADALVGILDVEPVEQNFFRGIATPGGRGRSFGGQVIAQALMAAIKTVPSDRPAHSLHGYFMRPGDATAPVLYQVERDRDGGSFTTRRVVAVQNGKPILNLAASFHVIEPGLSHQDDMPDVPPPEELRTEAELAKDYAGELPEAYIKWLSNTRPVEIRPAILRAPFDRTPRREQSFWFRVPGQIGDNAALHRAALAYASDFGLLITSAFAHGKAFADTDMQFASLDHAVWFHSDLRADDWLLYTMDSPWSGGARGFNRGRIFTRDGVLVANVAQEGLVRQVTPKA